MIFRAIHLRIKYNAGEDYILHNVSIRLFQLNIMPENQSHLIKF